MNQKTHKLSMKIIKILIESELSINDQLQVIQSVKRRLEFCKIKGHEINQLKLF